MSPPILIRGGRLLDPETGRDEVEDLYLAGGRIAPKPPILPDDALLLDARGLVVTPGLVDLHVHLREPGGEESETIETGSRAAARGGFTTIVAMPNTNPPADTPERIAWLKARAEAAGWVRVLPAACLTAGRGGRLLADLEALAAAGAAAFSDDGSTPRETAVMRQALERIARLNRPVLDHAQDPETERAGVMHEGEWSRKHRLPGIPAAAEVRMVRRDVELAEQTGCHVHIQHVSAAESVDLIADARRRRVSVSGEATPHHLALTDADANPDDTHFKVNPPLRGEADRRRLMEGISDGTLSAFATDHAPHAPALKAIDFLHAPFGMAGLETAVGITFTRLVRDGRMDLMTWLRRWTTGPAEILGLPIPSLRLGAPADLAVLDLSTEWAVDPALWACKSRNSPFAGWTLSGRAIHTILGGFLTHTGPG